MKNISRKVWKKLDECYREYKEFGWRYGTDYFATHFFFRKSKWRTRQRAINILSKQFSYIFENPTYSKGIDPSVREVPQNIYLFWAQGFNSLPYVVNEAIHRIKIFYPEYNLILLDMNNIHDYLSLDPRIVRLFGEHKITIQTLSDIIRCNLLYEYGGLWCDATLLFFKRYELKELIEKYGFISINDGDTPKKEQLFGKNVKVTHTTYFMGTYKGNNVMHALVDFFNDYYQRHEFAIDYNMLDLVLILCDINKISNGELDRIPYVKGSPFYLVNQLINGRHVNINQCQIVPQKLNWRDKQSIQRLKYINLI